MGLSIDTQNSVFGATHNPWMHGRSAGGSSGGSAAAVACRIVPAAYASDGAGSTWVPSSCCGVFGLKTSKGRVTYAPDVGDELSGMSTQHACTISVRDSAALLDVDGQPDFGDPYFAPAGPASYLEAIERPPGRLKIAFTTVAPNGVVAHQDCIDATMAAAKLCESLGHMVEEASPEVAWNDALADAVGVVLGVGMHSNVRAKAASKGVSFPKADFQPAIWKFLEIGEACSAERYYMSVRAMQHLARKMARSHERYDLLLTPTLPTPPLPLTDVDYGESGAANYLKQFWTVAAFMPLANASGQPAMTVPLHWNKESLPIGVQFVARYGNEELLLQLAAQLEQARPWANKLPPMIAL
jgi:amidase